MTPAARRLLVPALSTLAMLAVLLGLGTWQLQRLAWKRGVMAAIDTAERSPAVPLPAAPGRFEKVSVRGRLRPDLAALYGAEVRDAPGGPVPGGPVLGGPVLGGQVIVPLERAGAPPVLVDLGWIPADRRATLTLPDGMTTIDGYVRPQDHPGLFSATDDARARLFYTLDPPAIGAALGLPAVAPFTLVALGPTPPEGWPDPAHRLPRPPNNHLQYAITWYSLALVLVVVFVSYVRKASRP